MVVGILFAMIQRDAKRMLAFSTVSQIGYMFLGLGLGTPLGIVAGLLHCLNHGLFKGGLFLGAGAVQHATGTRDMDRLGGLRRRMPTTATLWMISAAAIAGVPLFNGFVSKWLIYTARFECRIRDSRTHRVDREHHDDVRHAQGDQRHLPRRRGRGERRGARVAAHDADRLRRPCGRVRGPRRGAAARSSRMPSPRAGQHGAERPSVSGQLVRASPRPASSFYARGPRACARIAGGRRAGVSGVLARALGTVARRGGASSRGFHRSAIHRSRPPWRWRPCGSGRRRRRCRSSVHRRRSADAHGRLLASDFTHTIERGLAPFYAWADPDRYLLAVLAFPRWRVCALAGRVSEWSSAELVRTVAAFAVLIGCDGSARRPA